MKKIQSHSRKTVNRTFLINILMEARQLHSVKIASFCIKITRLQNITHFEMLIHVINVVGAHNLILVTIRLKKSYSIFQTILVF